MCRREFKKQQFERRRISESAQQEPSCDRLGGAGEDKFGDDICLNYMTRDERDALISVPMSIIGRPGVSMLYRRAGYLQCCYTTLVQLIAWSNSEHWRVPMHYTKTKWPEEKTSRWLHSVSGISLPPLSVYRRQSSDSGRSGTCPSVGPNSSTSSHRYAACSKIWM